MEFAAINHNYDVILNMWKFSLHQQMWFQTECVSVNYVNWHFPFICSFSWSFSQWWMIQFEQKLRVERNDVLLHIHPVLHSDCQTLESHRSQKHWIWSLMRSDRKPEWEFIWPRVSERDTQHPAEEHWLIKNHFNRTQYK